MGHGREEFAVISQPIAVVLFVKVIELGARLINQALGEFRQRLQQSTDSAQSAAHAMNEQWRGLTAARRSLVWNGLIALSVGSSLAAGGAAWMVHQSMQQMAQAHFGQDILQATQRGAITRCGDSLCARVGKKPQRYGKDGQYLLLLNE